MASSSSAPTASPREIKLNMPLPFSGKREDLTKFWQDCCVFTSLNQWQDIQQCQKMNCICLISLLTKGEAASWKEQFVGQAILNCKKQGVPLDFGTFAVFKTNLFEAFKPFDETGDAWAKMKEMRFNGWTGNMDEHVARFKSLLTKTGMTDFTAIINCFRETSPGDYNRKSSCCQMHPKIWQTGTNGWQRFIMVGRYGTAP